MATAGGKKVPLLSCAAELAMVLDGNDARSSAYRSYAESSPETKKNIKLRTYRP